MSMTIKLDVHKVIHGIVVDLSVTGDSKEDITESAKYILEEMDTHNDKTAKVE